MLPNRPTFGILFLAVGLAGVSSSPRAAQAPVDEQVSGESAELTIGLPQGKTPAVSVSLGEGSVVLELPAGAEYPSDFAVATGGLLRGAERLEGPPDRIRLELRLAGGLFSGVAYRPDSVTLKFRRRIAPTTESADASGKYVLGAEDKLRIAINGQEEMTQESVVSRTGNVSAPLVGEVRAMGLSIAEFTAHLTELLARDYLVAPKVDVQVLEYRSQWVMVTGEVRESGRIPLRGNTTLKDVLAEAGGLKSEAGQTITITRQNTKPGEPSAISIDREAFERGESNPSVRFGDIITVEPTAFCYVNGEVKSPGKIEIARGLTLLRAISAAGGLTEWANRREVRVAEKDTEKPPRVFNLNKIETNPELDPPIRGGEVITVKRRFL